MGPGWNLIEATSNDWAVAMPLSASSRTRCCRIVSSMLAENVLGFVGAADGKGFRPFPIRLVKNIQVVRPAAGRDDAVAIRADLRSTVVERQRPSIGEAILAEAELLARQ